jgi:nucleotidyltransferase/DNA polymerase involved in DNA repair
MQSHLEDTALPLVESTSLPLRESTPAWTIRVPRPPSPDRDELARELLGVPKAALRQVFGKLLGTRLWQQNRAVAPSSGDMKNTKHLTAAKPVSNSEISGGMLRYLCTEAATTLQERKRFAKSVSLTVQYPNGESETAHQLLLQSTNDPGSLESAAHAAIRGMRFEAFVSVKLDLTATATQA